VAATTLIPKPTNNIEQRMSKITLTSLNEYRERGEKFTCLTAYDACFARLLSTNGIDVLLVGDSLGMVLQGSDNTLSVTMRDMIYHTKAVANGNYGSLIMADMPFMSYATPTQALDNASELLRAGAQIVKLEGGAHLVETVALLTQWGIPVCAHLGLTPQWVNQLGGFRVQGRSSEQAQLITHDVKLLCEAGAQLLLLECVPSVLAANITQQINVPVIGIGAGADVNGQVLVLHDALGISPGKRPRFVKNFLHGQPNIESAIKHYIHDVKKGYFPSPEHGFSE
jgi:3-methyl-2-oxobutanoate hydroxymethyltransferase